ncbi:MAG: DegV family protein [Coriobacteriia bacterium]|nr:DegV family protein [Coriobacteriia bacterium]
MSVRVITDSSNYVPQEELDALGVARVSLYVHDKDEMRPETEIDLDAFYRRLADTRVIPTSSQPSLEKLVEVFSNAVADGSDALGVFISRKMSGTVETAELAAETVRERLPNACIMVVDSASNCLQEGFAALRAAEKAASGASLAECAEAAKEAIRRTRFLFAPESLEYLARGGRISGASALLGSVLRIVPILSVEEGEVVVVAKVRTRARALAEIGTRMREDIEKYGFRRAAVHGIVDIDAARRFAREVVDGIVGSTVPVVPIGPVVGLHVGPAVGVVYETEEPMR